MKSQEKSKENRNCYSMVYSSRRNWWYEIEVLSHEGNKIDQYPSCIVEYLTCMFLNKINS